MRLKVNKTKMFKLISGYMLIPREVKLRNVHFRRYRGRKSYTMEWYGPRGDKGRAYLCGAMGKPYLVIETGLACNLYSDSKEHQLDINDLIERGMIEHEKERKQ